MIKLNLKLLKFTQEEFYHGFQVDQFHFNQISNRHLLGLTNEEIKKIINPVLEDSIKGFKKSIMMDIRLTFLFSVETLFELIFSLLSDKSRNLQDRDIIFKLPEKTYHSKDLRNLCDGKVSKPDCLR